MSEGELKKQIRCAAEHLVCASDTCEYAGTLPDIVRYSDLKQILGEAQEEYPKVSQKSLFTHDGVIDWETMCKLMEQKIIEFENFGKKWFGETK